MSLKHVCTALALAAPLQAQRVADSSGLPPAGFGTLEPLTVSYAGMSSTPWEQTLRLIEQERARVHARTATPRKG